MNSRVAALIWGYLNRVFESIGLVLTCFQYRKSVSHVGPVRFPGHQATLYHADTHLRRHYALRKVLLPCTP